MSGNEIIWLTNGTLKVASSGRPMKTTFSPSASCFSAVLRYTIRAIVEMYFPGSSFDSITDGIGSRKTGGDGRERRSGYNSLSIRELELRLLSLVSSTKPNHTHLFYKN